MIDVALCARPHAMPYGDHGALVRVDRFAEPARCERAYWHARRRADVAWGAWSRAVADLGATAERVAHAYAPWRILGPDRSYARWSGLVNTPPYAPHWFEFRAEWRHGQWLLDNIGHPLPRTPGVVLHPAIGREIYETTRRGTIGNARWLGLREVFDEAVRRAIAAPRAGMTYRVEANGRAYWFVGVQRHHHVTVEPVHGDGGLTAVAIDARERLTMREETRGAS